MEYVASYEKYSKLSHLSLLDIDDSTNKTEPWYWIPHHELELLAAPCHSTAWSACDHNAPLIGIAYGIPSTELLDS